MHISTFFQYSYEIINLNLYFQAYELSTLTGTQVMLLVASETGHVYTFATRKLQPMISSDAGKALIQVRLIVTRQKQKILGKNAKGRI